MNDTPRANNDTRAGAAQQLAHHWRAHARELRASETDESYMAEAQSLEHCAEALLSVYDPDVDLISSAARQSYIGTGIWPTRTEIAEHSTDPFTVVGAATYDVDTDVLEGTAFAGHADIKAEMADLADDDEGDITNEDMGAARALFADLEV